MRKASSPSACPATFASPSARLLSVTLLSTSSASS
eukprot:CAMPEP_0202414552 /NCGR_PEP_ID=MMETSP1128-20130828/33173_1 /ASSEMBLY_ACC=CAM_ASM_000463 /TAXON_ID=3047 /ORGANISM="Dunaliella tertiolecta, Strain CCMP1320" /LENGTH=34 /DNA_ID= /DNA_START= /DNA_END= /DNA_ORIENTATION=